jgi:O-antigen ligase
VGSLNPFVTKLVGKAFPSSFKVSQGVSLIGEVQRSKPDLRDGQQVGSLTGAFFWLSAFYLVYCTRPEDWIPGISYLPLAKITVVFALLGLLASWGRSKRKFRDLPRESHFLLALIALLFLSALLSPVWKGGALKYTLDFSKVWVVFVLTFLLVTDFSRLRRILFIQSASVAVISVVSIILGRNQARLEAVLAGNSNPNDLALAIVLTLPFVLAFVLTSKNIAVKCCWSGISLVMLFALFRTASRAGFISLVISGAVCLWYFGVKGRRLYLIAVTGVAALVLLAVAGGTLRDRFVAIGGEVKSKQQESAYGSYEERKQLMQRALEGIAHYPILGLGVHNFEPYSGHWKAVHMTYLQIAVEGGIPGFILYMLFFGRAFSNLRKIRRARDPDPQITLFSGALQSSMVAFAVGALFAPVAYEFFPYFSVAYTSVLLAIVQQQESPAHVLASVQRHWAFRATPSLKPSVTRLSRTGGRREPIR